jgi:predicted transposase/invertase (TIGR01784 family)
MVYDTKNQAIKEAVNVVLSLNKDKKMRTLALQRENALREYRSEMNAHIAKGIKEGIKKGKKEGIKEGMEKGVKKGIETGKKEGLEEGRKEGEQKEKIEIAKNLLNMGFNNEQIMKATGLSPENIERLK